LSSTPLQISVAFGLIDALLSLQSSPFVVWQFSGTHPESLQEPEIAELTNSSLSLSQK